MPSFFRKKGYFSFKLRKMRLLLLLFVAFALLSSTPSCNSGKTACPAYQDFGDKTSKSGGGKPGIPKARKAKSGVLPPGYKKK